MLAGPIALGAVRSLAAYLQHHMALTSQDSHGNTPILPAKLLKEGVLYSGRLSEEKREYFGCRITCGPRLRREIDKGRILFNLN